LAVGATRVALTHRLPRRQQPHRRHVAEKRLMGCTAHSGGCSQLAAALTCSASRSTPTTARMPCFATKCVTLPTLVSCAGGHTTMRCYRCHFMRRPLSQSNGCKQGKV
jgi:hypothetical protein